MSPIPERLAEILRDPDWARSQIKNTPDSGLSPARLQEALERLRARTPRVSASDRAADPPSDESLSD